MKISVSLKLDSLLRDLRLTGHALAESAEMKLLRAAQRRRAQAPDRAPADRRGKGGEA